MISSLKGILTEISPTNITIETTGIGYEIFIPLSTFDRLPKINSECKILTYLHVREDTHQLYGFLTHEEKDLFKLLLTISGIGPKSALTILSGMPIEDFKYAISSGDTAALSQIPGIGKKTGERLVVELKGRIGGITIKTAKPIPKEEEIILKDAMQALVNLGYKQQSSQAALEKIIAEESGKLNLEEIIKKALKYL